jgi:hypothetical protein
VIDGVVSLLQTMLYTCISHGAFRSVANHQLHALSRCDRSNRHSITESLFCSMENTLYTQPTRCACLLITYSIPNKHCFLVSQPAGANQASSMYLLRNRAYSVCRVDHGRSSLSYVLSSTVSTHEYNIDKITADLYHLLAYLPDHPHHSSLLSLSDLPDFRLAYNRNRHGSRSHPRDTSPQPRLRAEWPEVIRARSAKIRHHADSGRTILSREQAGVRRPRHFHRP